MSNNNIVTKPENPTQCYMTVVDTKLELIAYTKPKLIYLHKAGTHCQHKAEINLPTQYIHKVLKAFKLISCQEGFVSIFPNITSQDKAPLNLSNNTINP